MCSCRRFRNSNDILYALVFLIFNIFSFNKNALYNVFGNQYAVPIISVTMAHGLLHAGQA